jgi:hypothetical protein
VIGHLSVIDGGSGSMYDCGIVFWVPHIVLSSRKHLRDAGLVGWIISSAYTRFGRGR